MAAARVAIVGGGYSGAAAGVQLSRASGHTLGITIVEPGKELGRGLAYSTPDPDHRLNGPLDNHLVDPNQPDEMLRWCAERGIFERDPEVRAPNGAIYVRRGDFGAHVADVVRATPSITHHRARATGLRRTEGGFDVLAGDARIAAEVVIVATGNGTSSLPRVLDPLATHPAIIADPFDLDRLRAVAPGARVFLVGSGLTALDVISTLLRAGHRGRLTAFSRHGARPRPPRNPLPEGSTSGLMDRIDGEMPAYAKALTERGGGILALSRALRNRIAQAAERGEPWQAPFDELRNAVWRFWPRLPAREKRRFLRHLRTWYDAHRFRTPPQNAAMAEEAERAGALSYSTGRIGSARAEGNTIAVTWTDRAGAVVEDRFDAIVNCTGLDPSCGAASNPFLADLLSQGLVRVDPTGFGFEVDARCQPIGRDGTPSRGLFMVGPPTAGTFGDPLGVPFIAPQIRRMLPGVLAELR